ncbi:MAG: patatin-like phospholipase family protein [Bilophila wadsworthia]
MKIGLALGSGSARGWSHIGIIEALAELDIHPEIVCGTSIGSIVGAAYATGNLGRLKQRVCALTKLNTASYFNFSMSIDGFVNKEKLRAFFADCVTPPGMLHRRSARALCLRHGGEHRQGILAEERSA